MKLHNWLKSLSTTERQDLVEEMEISSGYLRLLSSNADKYASIELAFAIMESDVNLKLPNVLKFTEDDYIEHRKVVSARKDAKEAI